MGRSTTGNGKATDRVAIFLAVVMIAGFTNAWAQKDVPTKFSNRDSIVNTRHNLTQGVGGINTTLMDPHRNDYGEVCVYCHTPHGASTVVDAPLWNRTATNATYVTYDTLNTPTLTQPITAPGVNSLTCLSCHDGTVGIDSIINMPNRSPFSGQASGNYLAAQQTSQNNGFLDTWDNPGGTQASHAVLGSETTNAGVGCMACHSSGLAGSSFPQATDFRVMVIGTDLTNDHPIGVRYPATGPGVDFNEPTGAIAGVQFFDRDGDGRPDTDEIRMYDTGEGFEVECASCHDPHGVPSAGQGTDHNPTFLRVSNVGSGVCLTCHTK